ncbi:hypothetical protein GCM10007937_40290 [Mesorhizobium albiziae]|nr:hypothetical protein GCM10007937_40290 [Mesorhizobium albiziae]
MEVQQLAPWPRFFRQPSNQLPRGIHYKDAAIITVPLLGHAHWLQAAGAQPCCELCCNVVVAPADGVVMIGDRALPRAAIKEQQRPMGAAAVRIGSTGIVL